MLSALAWRTPIINATMVASDNFQFKFMLSMHLFHLLFDCKAFVIPDLYVHASRLCQANRTLRGPPCPQVV